ncbi:hypothetical protein [Streptomyces sp. NPDC088725]|uniref:hypothetical protein n=1 Tax=Streptomyces sp. NPDC088725 TaxID=3365873 RepID=UPI0037F1BDC7
MNEFLGAATGYPAVLFGAALLVVVVFWLLVLAGAVEHDAFSTHTDSDAFDAGGVPVTVPVSLMIVLAWFASLAGSVLVRRSDATGTTRTLLLTAVLVGALLLARLLTRLLLRPLRGLLAAQLPPSRLDFVGLTCTIRTGSVSRDFGQAEVAATDGSTALVQVRQDGNDPLPYGSTALLYAWDDDGEFFWVAPYDAALDPRNAV